MKEIDWKEYLDNYSNDWHGATATSADLDEDRRTALENTLVRAQSLTEHLLWQLRMNAVTQEGASATALLLGNMDKDGYLRMPIEEIAFQSGQDYEVVERALHTLQSLDPAGVAARDLRECLLLQLSSRDAGIRWRLPSCATISSFWRADATTRSPGSWVWRSRRSWRRRT